MRPLSGGTATSAAAAAAQHKSSARTRALAASTGRNAIAPAYFVPKSTFGADEISFSFSTVKFGFSL
jgi:hypothetical protein